MFKRTLIAITTLVIFVALLATPGLNSAEKRVSKSDPFSFLKKPVTFISSFLPIFGITIDSNSTKSTPSNSNGKVKPTGDSTASRPSGGD